MSKQSTRHQYRPSPTTPTTPTPTPTHNPASGPSAFTANALVWDPERKEGRVVPVTAMVHSPVPGTPGMLKISGVMGPVMHNSFSTAVTVARHTMAERHGQDLFKHCTILLAIPDFPEFLTEGDSAGLAAFAAAIGAMSGWESSPHVALTGTIDADGRIGRVGATEEKIQMAADNDVTMVVIPGATTGPADLVQDMRLSPEENAVMTIIRVTHAAQILTPADREAEEEPRV